ncbi:hypothetical protein ACJW31_06G018100 [Castanea mollissima]
MHSQISTIMIVVGCLAELLFGEATDGNRLAIMPLQEAISYSSNLLPFSRNAFSLSFLTLIFLKK